MMSEQVDALVDEISTRDDVKDRLMDRENKLQTSLKEKQVLGTQFRTSADEMKVELTNLKEENQKLQFEL